MKPKLTILTGAGISAESGIQTFRATNGLWMNHRVEDVASPAGWSRNRELVLEFYNVRRAEVLAAQPNAGHFGLAKLEEEFDVTIITQNIDDLHERAGSTNVIHLHGEILKGQSSLDPNIVVPLNGPRIEIGDKCPKGSQLRPHVVWFGEAILRGREAIKASEASNAFIVIGTSLRVQPAAGLCLHASPQAPRILIDPTPPDIKGSWILIQEPATTGVEKLTHLLNTL